MKDFRHRISELACSAYGKCFLYNVGLSLGRSTCHCVDKQECYDQA